jgi:hypothetical protein
VTTKLAEVYNSEEVKRVFHVMDLVVQSFEFQDSLPK